MSYVYYDPCTMYDHLFIGAATELTDPDYAPTCERCAAALPWADGGLILQEAIYEPNEGAYMYRICDECAAKVDPALYTLYEIYRRSLEKENT